MKKTAEDLAKEQKEISISEFFEKNKHLLGFDNPTKALLMTVKEATDNALDACEVSDKPNRHVVLSTSEHEGKLVYEVADDGVGIDYDIKKKIFTTFFSTKVTGKGTGLGLLTTRKIVQEHGGKVSFDSSEGSGSIFRLEFAWAKLPRPKKDKQP